VLSAPPRLAALDLLWRRGFPSVLSSPDPVVPAAIVWVDAPDDPALHLLPRAFGGHLLLEMRDHHGEASPAFWLGVGRSAVLAAAALTGWRAAREAGVDDRADVRHADGGALLGAGVLPAWTALHEIAGALLRPEPDVTGADLPDAADLRDAVGALQRAVERALPIAPHIASGLALALGGALRDAAARTPVHVLPSRAERDAWVGAFLARLGARD
jgi:hypothetical protein